MIAQKYDRSARHTDEVRAAKVPNMPWHPELHTQSKDVVVVVILFTA